MRIRGFLGRGSYNSNSSKTEPPKEVVVKPVKYAAKLIPSSIITGEGLPYKPKVKAPVLSLKQQTKDKGE
jgi:hypothetical protein